MTYPCIDEDQFDMVDGTHLTPKPHMAFRHVATNEAAGITRSYDPDLGSQAEDLYTVAVAWTNTDPIPMNVYALVTRGGSSVYCSTRNVIYLEQYAGMVVGVAPADPATSTLISRFGTGLDFATTSSEPNFGVAETRAGDRAALVGATEVVDPGETYKVRVRVRVDGLVWETVEGAGGPEETEISIASGATRLDLFAYPVIA